MKSARPIFEVRSGDLFEFDPPHPTYGDGPFRAIEDAAARRGDPETTLVLAATATGREVVFEQDNTTAVVFVTIVEEETP